MERIYGKWPTKGMLIKADVLPIRVKPTIHYVMIDTYMIMII